MGWVSLTPRPRSGGKKTLSAIMIGMNAAGRFRPRMRLVLRPKLLKGASLKWVAEGKACGLQLGTDADAGVLRIIPDGPFEFGLAGGRNTEALALSLDPFPGMRIEKQKAQIVDFTVGTDGTIQIRLPAWARPPASSSPTPGAPFKGALASHGVLSADEKRRINAGVR